MKSLLVRNRVLLALLALGTVFQLPVVGFKAHAAEACPFLPPRPEPLQAVRADRHAATLYQIAPRRRFHEHRHPPLAAFRSSLSAPSRRRLHPAIRPGSGRASAAGSSRSLKSGRSIRPGSFYSGSGLIFEAPEGWGLSRSPCMRWLSAAPPGGVGSARHPAQASPALEKLEMEAIVGLFQTDRKGHRKPENHPRSGCEDGF